MDSLDLGKVSFNHHLILNGLMNELTWTPPTHTAINGPFYPQIPTAHIMDHSISSSISLMDSLDPADPLNGLVHLVTVYN